MSKKHIIIAISIIIVIGLGGYLATKMYNKPHINIAEASPDLILNSDEILTDFQSDETSANKKYLNQIIQVKGKVGHIGAANGNGVIVFNNNNISAQGSVICHILEGENNKIMQLKEGQDIIIKGVCTGYLMDVILIRCVIIN
ncbi:OB-fold putative lipoprotein [Abyssalbus ytuae]|uniref:OB-fold putative lipoprotein n=1 Tax=Abyssalbus ytuae TaxID=2926907 RepID=A0A9E7CUB7_9FLAO|nr:OB-fold putative lipoprotein [Abyssalbus ytuae]UOB18117.1 OB-fold putative lipoprotein [Abyssalbus ytuae]